MAGKDALKVLESLCKAGLLLAAFRSLIAYLDPGSGSLLAQLLVAAIVGILATLRFWKARFLSLFGIHPDPDNEGPPEEPEQAKTPPQ